MNTDKNRQYRGVMFDLDGTLLNTIEDLADSVNAALERAGLPSQPLDHYYTAVGDGAEAMVQRSLPTDRRDAETLRRVHAFTRDEYTRRWNNKTRPYAGVPEMLDTLFGAGLTVCILSNKPHNSTLKVVAEFLPNWNFHRILGAREGVPIKPDPQAALEIAEEFSIPAEHWLYCGDTDTDMQTSTAAGFFTVGVSWGFRSVRELRENGADLIVDEPARIASLALETASG